MNNAIFFLSHPLAIHGISPRGIGKHDRRLINLSLELDSKNTLSMFDYENILDKSLSRKVSIHNPINKLIRKLGIDPRKINNKYGMYSWKKFKDL